MKQQELAVTGCHEAVHEQSLVFPRGFSVLVNTLEIHASWLPLEHVDRVERCIEHELEDGAARRALSASQ